ncbi:Nicotinate phosphoribosyltransferase [Candidatus Hydrogenisulfobacillus filiaventi]|uniref:Nicotinate phosphoribosyltransferase n=1 Tax=Candidatus Hydrogenisulfobacillus filiaventi TaxID=2707344 RepID=A0A6F8ZGJ1_9FIRM|nr:nicotinate phosphoribosyltransferase [Bacillota bacterium]CAB1128712.1 Nicotinate phosphoribosyltransferase [Candidatus Hydrogenisulfobacillus filiaventi]
MATGHDGLERVEEVRAWVPPDRGLRSATPEEIRAGYTTDVYFVGTRQVLAALGRQDTPVTAEIFANEAGLLAGVEEALSLLAPLPVTVEALDEGTPVVSRQVVMRIRGRYRDFGIFETALLGILASSSGWATRTREIVEAARPLPVISFGARHVHPAVASVMDRAALVGGAAGASSVLGARQAGQIPQGTMPHALILIVGDTVEAARVFDRLMPPDTPRTVLVDTFHDEAEEALRVAAALGDHLAAVRLDTPRERGGVTPHLVRELKARLSQAGFGHVGIFVSGGLTPERVVALKEAGASGFGVGSWIAGAPPLDMTMDLKEVDGRPVAKRGRIPGITPSPGLRLRLEGFSGV